MYSVLFSIFFVFQSPIVIESTSSQCDCGNLSVQYITTISSAQTIDDISFIELQEIEEDLYEQMEAEDWLDQMREEASSEEWLESVDMDLEYDN